MNEEKLVKVLNELKALVECDENILSIDYMTVFNKSKIKVHLYEMEENNRDRLIVPREDGLYRMKYENKGIEFFSLLTKEEFIDFKRGVNNGAL